MTDKPSLPIGYVVPKLWVPKENGGVFSSINRPTAGKRNECELPRGKHDIQLYSLGTPNGQKVTILLEELGIEYDAWYINIRNGDQFGSGFVDVNPNSKIPAMLDYSVSPPIRVFESVSIMLYLAEKYNSKLVPKTLRDKTEMMNWLIWQVGTAPYIGGGFGHFYKYAPVNIEYAIDRFAMETKRIIDVLDQQLEGRKFILGDDLSLADIAVFPWILGISKGYNADEFLQLHEYKNVAAWKERLLERPAVQLGLRINVESEGGIREKH